MDTVGLLYILQNVESDNNYYEFTEKKVEGILKKFKDVNSGIVVVLSGVAKSLTVLPQLLNTDYVKLVVLIVPGVLGKNQRNRRPKDF